MFSCEFCEISKNTFLYRTPLLATSDFKQKYKGQMILEALFLTEFLSKKVYLAFSIFNDNLFPVNQPPNFSSSLLTIEKSVFTCTQGWTK